MHRKTRRAKKCLNTLHNPASLPRLSLQRTRLSRSLTGQTSLLTKKSTLSLTHEPSGSDCSLLRKMACLHESRVSQSLVDTECTPRHSTQRTCSRLVCPLSRDSIMPADEERPIDQRNSSPGFSRADTPTVSPKKKTPPPLDNTNTRLFRTISDTAKYLSKEDTLSLTHEPSSSTSNLHSFTESAFSVTDASYCKRPSRNSQRSARDLTTRPKLSARQTRLSRTIPHGPSSFLRRQPTLSLAHEPSETDTMQMCITDLTLSTHPPISVPPVSLSRQSTLSIEDLDSEGGGSSVQRSTNYRWSRKRLAQDSTAYPLHNKRTRSSLFTTESISSLNSEPALSSSHEPLRNSLSPPSKSDKDVTHTSIHIGDNNPTHHTLKQSRCHGSLSLSKSLEGFNNDPSTRLLKCKSSPGTFVELGDCHLPCTIENYKHTHTAISNQSATDLLIKASTISKANDLQSVPQHKSSVRRQSSRRLTKHTQPIETPPLNSLARELSLLKNTASKNTPNPGPNDMWLVDLLKTTIRRLPSGTSIGTISNIVMTNLLKLTASYSTEDSEPVGKCPVSDSSAMPESHSPKTAPAISKHTDDCHGISKRSTRSNARKVSLMCLSNSDTCDHIDEAEEALPIFNIHALTKPDSITILPRRQSTAARDRSVTPIYLHDDTKQGVSLKKRTRANTPNCNVDLSIEHIEHNPVLEIVFSFNTTGLMYRCVELARSRLKDMLTRLQVDVPNARIAIVAHGDYCHLDFYQWIDFGSSIDELCDFFQRVKQTSGFEDTDKCYELVLHRIQHDLSWTTGSRRSLVMIGDSNPHSQLYAYILPTDKEAVAGHQQMAVSNIDWKDETLALKKMGVRIYCVHEVDTIDTDLTCENPGTVCNARPFYSTLATWTGGAYIWTTQFAHVTEILMAICYREADNKLIWAFECDIRTTIGGQLHRNLDLTFVLLRPRIHDIPMSLPSTKKFGLPKAAKVHFMKIKPRRRKAVRRTDIWIQVKRRPCRAAKQRALMRLIH